MVVWEGSSGPGGAVGAPCSTHDVTSALLDHVTSSKWYIGVVNQVLFIHAPQIIKSKGFANLRLRICSRRFQICFK